MAGEVTQSNVQPPKQARSRKTLEALLAAGEPLLAEKPFADVTVSEIVQRAQSSSGSFYARFADKDAYFRELQQRFVEHGLDVASKLVAQIDGPIPVLELTPLLIDSLVRTHASNVGVVRSVHIESASNPEVIEPLAQLVRDVAEATASVVDKDDFIGSPSDQIEVGLLTVLAMLNQDMFYGQRLRTSASGTDEEVMARLQRVFLASMELENR